MSYRQISHTFDPQDDSILSPNLDVPGDVVVLSGVGELALQFLLNDNSTVHFVTSSIESYNLVILKYLALRNLVSDNVYNLLGVHPSGRRVFVYHQLKNALPKSSRDWWDSSEDWIRTGILGSGQFELQYRRWFKKVETLIGGWPNHNTLEEQQHFVEWLQQRNRWTVLNRISPKPWIEEWLDSMRHTLLQHNQYICMAIDDSEKWCSGPSVYTKAGMQAVQESSTPIQVHHQDTLEWLMERKENSLSRVVLGTGISIGETLYQEIVRTLHPMGRVELWSRTPPKNQMKWTTSLDKDRGFHSGRLWQGTIAEE